MYFEYESHLQVLNTVIRRQSTYKDLEQISGELHAPCVQWLLPASAIQLAFVNSTTLLSEKIHHSSALNATTKHIYHIHPHIHTKIMINKCNDSFRRCWSMFKLYRSIAGTLHSECLIYNIHKNRNSKDNLAQCIYPIPKCTSMHVCMLLVWQSANIVCTCL